MPGDPTFNGWSALGAKGGISPHSRTSVMFSPRLWPLKPDICMEGGNVITDGQTNFHERHPLLSLRSTDSRSDSAIGSVNATSAATAQAATACCSRPGNLSGTLARVDPWPDYPCGRVDRADA